MLLASAIDLASEVVFFCCCSHEDGSVRFWDVSSTDISLIYKLATVNIFNLSTANEEVDNNADMEDEWPPFRKAS